MGKSSMAIFHQPENQCELFKMLVNALETKIISILHLQNSRNWDVCLQSSLERLLGPTVSSDESLKSSLNAAGLIN